MTIPSEATSKPRIQSYLDLRQYLQDLYQWRKGSEPGFSYSQWAEEIGFKSRSFLRLVVTGKRSVTEKSIPLFVKGLGLTPTEGRYFEKLVRFSQAPSVEVQEHRFKDLMQSARFERSEIQDYYQFVSSPIGPRLQVLLGLKDLKRTSENLAHLLGESRAEVEKCLEVMKRLQLAAFSESEEEWVAQITRFGVSDHLGDIALQSYHRKSLEESARAIDLPVETRRYQSAVLTLSEKEFEEFCREMTRFLEATLASHDHSEGAGRRVYQINIGAIPVSKPILHSERSRSEPVGEVSEFRSVEAPLSHQRSL